MTALEYARAVRAELQDTAKYPTTAEALQLVREQQRIDLWVAQQVYFAEFTQLFFDRGESVEACAQAYEASAVQSKQRAMDALLHAETDGHVH